MTIRALVALASWHNRRAFRALTAAQAAMLRASERVQRERGNA